MMTVKHHRGRTKVSLFRHEDFFELERDTLWVVDSFFAPFCEEGEYESMFIHANENNKTLETSLSIIRALEDRNLSKISVVGGGIIQDIASFAASIYKRGIEWDFYPTTLAAMADSCIGGKTSINVDGVKNKLGSFHPAKNVLIYPQFLKTLTNSQVRDGLGEIQHMIMCYTSTTKDLKVISDLVSSVIAEDNMHKFIRLINNSLWYKKNFVEKDEFDENTRRLLNLGHTFGHALEYATDNTISHGQAVSWGIYFALMLTPDFCGKNTYKKLVMPNVPVNWRSNFDRDKFFVALKKDKKNIKDGELTAILWNGAPYETQVLYCDVHAVLEEI